MKNSHSLKCCIMLGSIEIASVRSLQYALRTYVIEQSKENYFVNTHIKYLPLYIMSNCQLLLKYLSLYDKMRICK